MRNANIILSSVLGLAIIGLLACSGGSSSPTPIPDPPKFATGLGYTDPGSTGYRLVKSAASTSKKLILELKGPASEMGRGVSFGLTVDGTKARFVKVDNSDTEYAQNETFILDSTPQLFKAVPDGNNALRASIAQKGPGRAQVLSGVLARVALQLQDNVSLGNITFSAVDARVLRGDSGASTPITIDYGTLVAQ